MTSTHQVSADADGEHGDDTEWEGDVGDYVIEKGKKFGDVDCYDVYDALFQVLKYRPPCITPTHLCCYQGNVSVYVV